MGKLLCSPPLEQWDAVSVEGLGHGVVMTQNPNYRCTASGDYAQDFTFTAAEDGNTHSLSTEKATTRLEGVDKERVLAKIGDRPMTQPISSRFSNRPRIGADPECFVLDEGGKVVPAFWFLKGKMDLGAGVGIPFWDGFQAEFTTRSTHCLDGLKDDIGVGLAATLKAAQAQTPGARLTAKSFFEIPEERFFEANPVHRELGCAPSLNVYGLHPTLEGADGIPIRTTGGHMHFGLSAGAKRTIPEIVRLLDKVVGIVGVSVADTLDHPDRRVYYGQPGEYRTPAHGLEYRTLSSFWLAAPPLMHLMFELGRACCQLGARGLEKYVWDAQEAEVVETILGHDVERARHIIARNLDQLTFILKGARGGDCNAVLMGLHLAQEGHTALLRESDNIQRYWGIWGGTHPAGCNLHDAWGLFTARGKEPL